MTQNNKGSYGLQWPKWYVYWRGRGWLGWGCCPNCYSSPPNNECRVCLGSYDYGPKIDAARKILWRVRWDKMKGKTCTVKLY